MSLLPPKRLPSRWVTGNLIFFVSIALFSVSGAAAQPLENGQAGLPGNLQAPTVAGHAYTSTENAHQLIEERLQREKQMPARDYRREIIVKWKKPADEAGKQVGSYNYF